MPAGTPKGIIDVLYHAIAKAFAQPDLKERWASMDYDERWNLTVILEPWRLSPLSGGRWPLDWEALLEKWRSYRRRVG